MRQRLYAGLFVATTFLAVAPLALATVSASVDVDEGSGSGDPAATPGVAPRGMDVAGVYLDQEGRPMEVDRLGQPVDDEVNAATSSASAVGPCTPVSGRDNPHRSSTGIAVSGHGWWDRGDCDGSRADVMNCLGACRRRAQLR